MSTEVKRRAREREKKKDRGDSVLLITVKEGREKAIVKEK